MPHSLNPAQHLRSLVAAALGLSIVACSGTPEAAPVGIASFTATPSPALVTDAVTLAWVVSGPAVRLELQQDGTALDPAPSPIAGGSRTIAGLAPGEHVFVLRAFDAAAAVAEAQVKINVLAPVRVEELKAEPPSIRAGEPSTISWRTTGATTAQLFEDDTQRANVPPAEVAAGSYVVQPTFTRTYRLVATGPGGSAEATVRVEVPRAPLFNVVELAPTRVARGGTTTLSWRTSAASALVVRAGDEVVFTAPDGEVAEGHTDLTVTETTTFEVSASGSGGEAQAQRTVTVVDPAHITAFSANPPEVLIGGTTTLAWVTAGIDALTLTANGVPVDIAAKDPSEDILDVTPVEDTVYELHGTGLDGSDVATTTVHVYGQPVIDSFEADASSIVAGEGSVVLSWRTRNGSSVALETSDGTPVDVSAQPADAGSIELTPTETTTWVLTLVGPGGVVQSAPVTVTVTYPLPTATLTLGEPRVVQGRTTTLAWNVTGHTTMRITATPAGGAAQNLDLSGRVTSPGSAHDVLTLPAPTKDTAYELIAEGPGGTTRASATLILIRPPVFTSFTSDHRVAGTDEVRVTRGRSFQLSWTTTDADMTHLIPRRMEPSALPFTSILDLPDTIPVELDQGLPNQPFAVVDFPAGFSFPFYGTSRTWVRMASDGYLCFGNDSVCGYASSGGNRAIPNTEWRPDLYVAPFHTDLAPLASTRHAMFLDSSGPVRRLIFEWNGTDFRSPYFQGVPLTFQAVLHEDGEWELWNAPRAADGGSPTSIERWGSTATLGVEGPGGTDGIQVSYAATAGLCSSFIPPTATQPASCTPITRWRPERLAASGTETVVADANKVLRMRAWGLAGSGDSPTLNLVTYAEPLINRFDADRTLIGAGESATLTWSTGGDNAVRTLSGLPAPVAVSGGGTRTVSPTTTTTYTLTVTNRAGDSITKDVTVRVDAPDVVFGVRNLSARTPAPAGTPIAQGASGDRFELSWSATSAKALTITDPSGATIVNLTAPTDAARIAAGTHEVVRTQSGVFTLTATNLSGPRTATAAVAIPGDVSVVSFNANVAKQTAGEPVTLTWETWNAASVEVRVAGESAVLPCSANARTGSCVVSEGNARTTWELTARDGAGNVATATVSVASVPVPELTLDVTPGVVDWIGQVTVSWSIRNAAKQRLYRRTSSDVAPGIELAAARTGVSGNLNLVLQRDTSFELVAQNELGFQTSIVRGPVDVQVSSVGADIAASTTDVPRGGTTTITWNTPGSARTTFWQRDPPDAPSLAVNAEEYTDRVDVPVELVEGGFVDISATGEELTLRRDGNVDFATGYALRDLPEDFVPEFFGLQAGRVLVSASGLLMFVPRGAPDSAFELCLAADCSGFNLIQADRDNPTGRRALLAPFWGRLTARYGCVNPFSCQASTVPGRVFWELQGTAPNRRLVVQWDRWDGRQANSTGEYTFEAILRENGDSEIHHKTMRSFGKPFFERGCETASGAERRDARGPYRNWFVAVSSRGCGLRAGEGYLMHTGVQPSSGSIRALSMRAEKTERRSRRWRYRVTAENPEAPAPRATSIVDLKQMPGIGDFSISELMLSPDQFSSQWVELQSDDFSEDIPLAGYSIVTPSGSWTFNGGVLPATPIQLPWNPPSPRGYALLGPDADSSTYGGASPSATWPRSIVLPDTEGYVAIARGESIIDRVEYGASWPQPTHRSLSFDAPQDTSGVVADFNDDPLTWCGTNGTNGARSTPGAPNSSCHEMEPMPFDPSLDIESDPAAIAVRIPGGPAWNDSAVQVTLPFPFTHFGRTYPGPVSFVRFGALIPGPLIESFPVFLPDNKPLPLSDGVTDGLYPYWDDLAQTPNSRMLYRVLGTAPNRVMVFEWVGFTPQGGTGELTFLVALRESGGFEFHYKRLGDATGSSATIGFEGRADTFGVNYVLNSAALPPAGWSVPFGLRYRHKP